MCSGMTMKLAKRETSRAIELLTGETIDNLEETGQKSYDILAMDDIIRRENERINNRSEIAGTV